MKKSFLYTTLLALCPLLLTAQASKTQPVALNAQIVPNEDPLQDMGSVQPCHSQVLYDSAGLDSFIRATMASQHIPGVATWCRKNRQVIWQHCYGYANLEDSIEVADTTSFMLASISKTFVGTAIMQLWERGEFDLDEDINNYLPFSVRNPNFPDSIITFKMLMTHTSSIRDNWDILNPLNQPGDPTIALGYFVNQYLVPGGTYYTTYNFNSHVPGSFYDYTNVGAALLGYLVEVIEDSFPVHCQDSIFEPLAMNHTSWFLAGLDTNNLARRYDWLVNHYIRLPHIGCPFYPSGKLKASMLDIAQHLIAITQGGIIDTVRILDSSTVNLMLTPHFGGFIGLTWFYYYLYGRMIWYHPGIMTGAYTMYGFCPNQGSEVIVLTNGGSYYDGTLPIADALFDYAQQFGIEEQQVTKPIESHINLSPTIFRGPLLLPEGKKCRVYDITGRVVEPDQMKPGIYFIKIDDRIVQKVIKIK